jgi:hypothetical protein
VSKVLARSAALGSESSTALRIMGKARSSGTLRREERDDVLTTTHLLASKPASVEVLHETPNFS